MVSVIYIYIHAAQKIIPHKLYLIFILKPATVHKTCINQYLQHCFAEAEHMTQKQLAEFASPNNAFLC